jgi:hypothetical protein
MNRTAKPARSHPVAPAHAAGAEAAPNGASAEPMRAFAVRTRAEHLAELRTYVGLPVEFDPTGRVCGGIFPDMIARAHDRPKVRTTAV